MRSDANKQGAQGELHAKPLSCTRFLGCPARRPPRVLQGNKDVAAAPVGGGAIASTRTPSPARLEAAAAPAGQ